MNEITWGMPVVIYLFLAGLGAGGFCLGMVLSKRRGLGWESCSRMAFLMSPVAIAIGLLMLILDLRNKFRFWRTLTVLNLQSPMSIGVWLLSAFFLIAFFSAIFPKWRKRIGPIGMVLALGISVYTGVLLSATVIPLWRNLSLPLFFFISALSLGIEGGAILGIMSLKKERLDVMEEPLQFLRRSYRVILPVYCFAAMLFFVLLIATAPRETVFHFITGWCGLIWWVGVVLIGILLPLILVMKKRRESMRHAWVLSVCLLVGDFLLRFVLIMAGQGAL
jgi:formate-dependent nitrite reductase membrane component NrfD